MNASEAIDAYNNGEPVGLAVPPTGPLLPVKCVISGVFNFNGDGQTYHVDLTNVANYSRYRAPLVAISPWVGL